MKNAGIFLLSLTMAVGLGGCDIRDKIPLTPKDALRLADPFGAATREEQVSDKDGDTFVFIVESKREGSWSGADMAIRRQYKNLCPDGQRPNILERSPKLLSDSAAARNVSHPAGTTYRLLIHCPAQPYEELDFEPGISRRDAEMLIQTELMGGEWREGRHALVLSLPVSEWTRKYEWMNEMIGMQVSGQLRLCSGGVIIRRVLIGNYAQGHQPRPASEKDDRPEFVFGLLSDCADGVNPEAFETPEKSP